MFKIVTIEGIVNNKRLNAIDSFSEKNMKKSYKNKNKNINIAKNSKIIKAE